MRGRFDLGIVLLVVLIACTILLDPGCAWFSENRSAVCTRADQVCEASGELCRIFGTSTVCAVQRDLCTAVTAYCSLPPNATVQRKKDAREVYEMQRDRFEAASLGVMDVQTEDIEGLVKAEKEYRQARDAFEAAMKGQRSDVIPLERDFGGVEAASRDQRSGPMRAGGLELNPLLLSIIGTMVRRALFGVFTWLAANGWIKGEDSDQLLVYLGAGVAVVAWSVWQKVRAHIALKTALQLPAGTTMEGLKEAVKHPA